MKFSNSSYQFDIGLSVDGTDTTIYSVAKLTNVGSGQQTEGNINVIVKVTLTAGQHTLSYYGKTNNGLKTVTFPAYASFDVYLVKI